jgi:hypothetical protein
MRKLASFLVLALLGTVGFYAARYQDPADTGWTSHFLVEPLSTTGRNPYFILEPGYTLDLVDGKDRLLITVLDQTKRVANVDTRIVEEREWVDGVLVEVSRNFFAISRRTNSVYYFGEEVDIYEKGRIVEHEGAWEAGAKGARFGLMMPGLPLLKARHYQEIAPGVAMDRAEIISLTDSLITPAGVMRDLLRVAETTPLEPAEREYKRYAPGIGLVQDGSMKLAKYGSK